MVDRNLVCCYNFGQQRVLAELSEQPNCRGEEPSSLHNEVHNECSEKVLIRGPDYQKNTYLQTTTAIVSCEFANSS